MAIAGAFYHVGIVVSDLPRAMEELGELLGLTWLPAFGQPTYQLLHSEQIPVEPLVTYSRQGPPYVELIQQRPGTVWDATGLHHLGVWTDSMRQESDRFTQAGVPLDSVGTDAEGNWTSACYHRTAEGLRVELIDIGHSGPRLARYLSGGSYR